MQGGFGVTMNWDKKKVVVTGGAGFIGINLVKALCAAGADVLVLDLPGADFSALPVNSGSLRCDILDKGCLESAVSDADFVFHLAARTDLSGKSLDSYKVNFVGTANLLDALKSNTRLTKFIHFSTQLVVGLFDETRFINEHEPYRTKTLYGHSKILAEKTVMEKCPLYGIPFIILRPTSVYGPHGKEPYRDLFLTIKNRRYFHIGKADNLISMVYVKNIVDQCMYLASVETHDRVFFGNDMYPYTMRAFANAVAAYFGYDVPTVPYSIAFTAAYALGILKVMGIDVPLYPFRLRNIRANCCYDIGNSMKVGYIPRYALLDGVKECLDWYVGNDPDFQK
jgi:nucleoside-diphosphate-sugar epimerase